MFNGSPLFTGAAGSGESEIRRWIIENDWLEAVVALPDQLFYNTGISTYFWIVTNRKSPNRKGKVQLIDARDSFTKMRKSLGEKRKEVSDAQIAEIVRLYGNFDQQHSDEDEARVKIFPNESFGFLRITVERPLRLRWEITDESADALLSRQEARQARRAAARGTGRTRRADARDATFDGDVPRPADARRWMAAGRPVKGKPIENAIVDALAVRDPDADPITDKHGNPEPDADLRDNENVPLPPDPVRYEPDPTDRLATDTYVKAVEQYVEQEVHPYVPDALGRPHQDQDRLRDPPHEALLRLHTTQATGGDRRRDQAARAGDPGPAARGDGVTRTRFRSAALARGGRSPWASRFAASSSTTMESPSCRLDNVSDGGLELRAGVASTSRA